MKRTNSPPQIEYSPQIRTALERFGFSTDPQRPFPPFDVIDELATSILTSPLPMNERLEALTATMHLQCHALTLEQQPSVLASAPSETTTTLAKRWKDDDDDDVPPQPPAASTSNLTVPHRQWQQPPSPPHHHTTPAFSIVTLESTMPGIPAGTFPPQADLEIEAERFGPEIIQLNAVLLFPSLLEATDFSQKLFDRGVRSDSGKHKYVGKHRKGDPRFGVVLTQDDCTTLGFDLEVVFSEDAAVQTWQAQKTPAPQRGM